jgi:hypothetical protein
VLRSLTRTSGSSGHVKVDLRSRSSKRGSHRSLPITESTSDRSEHASTNIMRWKKTGAWFSISCKRSSRTINRA